MHSWPISYTLLQVGWWIQWNSGSVEYNKRWLLTNSSFNIPLACSAALTGDPLLATAIMAEHNTECKKMQQMCFWPYSSSMVTPLFTLSSWPHILLWLTPQHSSVMVSAWVPGQRHHLGKSCQCYCHCHHKGNTSPLMDQQQHYTMLRGYWLNCTQGRPSLEVGEVQHGYFKSYTRLIIIY